MKSNKEQIAELVKDMFNDSYKHMLKNIDKVLDSGCIDIESWDKDNNPMILPRCIIIAILQNESTQYDAKGTFFEKYVKKEVENIRYFL